MSSYIAYVEAYSNGTTGCRIKNEPNKGKNKHVALNQLQNILKNSEENFVGIV